MFINKFLEILNGITLISLMVTIVVLLILAGISIVILTGDNGIITRTEKAKEETEKAYELETIKLAVVDAVTQGTDGRVSKANLVTALRKIPEVVATNNVDRLEASENTTGPWTIIGKKASYEVTGSAIVTKISGLTVGGDTIKEGAVKAVTVIKAGSAEGKTVTWEVKSGNVTFVAGLKDSTPVASPTGDTVYVKAGAYTSGASGIIKATATDEEPAEATITITEAIASATLTGPSTVQTAKTAETALVVTVTGTSSTQTNLTSGVTYNQTSSDGGAVTINPETGAVTGSTVGTVSVTATIDGSLTNTGNSITTSAITINVTEPEFVLGEPAENSAVNYGKKVIDYKSNAESSQDEIGWRIFYQDTEGNTYLIADKILESYKPSENWGSHTGANTSAQGKGLNLLVKNLLITYSSYDNMKATSWFTDREVWSNYTDSNTNDKATFAIASPTIELYVKSYNAVAAINSSVNSIEYPLVETYGYKYSGYPRVTTEVNGIYSKGSGNNSWWLSSPSYNYENYCLIVSSYYNDLGNYAIVDEGKGIRPVVCIPTSEIGNTL